jgi:GT2 family glycosyltransferase
MRVHIVKPYSLTGNLGKAYNETMALMPDNDWCCLMDCDTMFLTPDCGSILHEYARQVMNTYTWAGLYPILTCYTNRINPNATHQLLNGHFYDDDQVLPHIKIAQAQRSELYKTTEIKQVISGFLMMVHRKTWDSVHFCEDLKCLGVDNDFSRRVLATGRKILRMEGLYIWHNYRLANGIHDKSHLMF